MDAMKKEKKEIHTDERYKKSNQIYKIQCSMTVKMPHVPQSVYVIVTRLGDGCGVLVEA